MGEKSTAKSPPKSRPKPPALQTSCPATVADPPADWEGQLPPSVPPVEGPAGPADVTRYLPLPLAGAYPTGVFIPQAFSYDRNVDVILFFHGNRRGPGLSPFQYISEYWSGKYYNVDLRGDLNASKINAILVA